MAFVWRRLCVCSIGFVFVFGFVTFYFYLFLVPQKVVGWWGWLIFLRERKISNFFKKEGWFLGVFVGTLSVLPGWPFWGFGQFNLKFWIYVNFYENPIRVIVIGNYCINDLKFLCYLCSIKVPWLCFFTPLFWIWSCGYWSKVASILGL